MTWPPTATRAEILRILEINAHIYTEWVITRAETEAILELLAERDAVLVEAEQRLAALETAVAAVIASVHVSHGEYVSHVKFGARATRTPFTWYGVPTSQLAAFSKAMGNLAALAPGPKEGRDG